MIEGALTSRQFRSRLKQAGVSQRKFALWAGFDVGTVNRWANDRREVPKHVELLLDLLRKYPEIVKEYGLESGRADRPRAHIGHARKSV